MKIAILGAGMVGRTIAFDLTKSHEVTSFDISDKSLRVLNDLVPSVKTVAADLNDYNEYEKILRSFDFVVSAVPGFMGYETLKAIIKAKKDVADISFFPENSLDLDILAKENNVTAIVDCGVAPGMSNYVLGYLDAQMDISEFECLVGGLPVKRVKPYEYTAPFSPIDVIEEYTRPSRMMENGSIVTKPALSEAEFIDFKEVGTLEAFNTDGLRSILITMGHIPNMREKTLRYPGHIDLIKALQKGGFFDTNAINFNGIEISPLVFSSKVLIDQWKLAPGEKEFTLMSIKVSGNQNGQRRIITYNLFDLGDEVNNLSSMGRTTGYTCTASLHLLMNGLFKEKGVFPPELVGKNAACFQFVMRYLEERGVIYEVKEQ